MTKRKTNTTKNIAFKSIALLTAFISTLLITNMVVSKCGKEMYGFYSLANDFVNYAMILSVALNSMASRYITISYYRNELKVARSYFSSVFFANIILAFFMLLIGLIIVFNLEYLINITDGKINEVKMLFVFVFLNFIVTIIASVFSVATYMNNRVDLDSIRQTESYIIQLLISIGLLYAFPPHVTYLGIAILISGIYIAAVNVQYTKKLTSVFWPVRIQYVNLSKIKEILSSGVWNSITRIGTILMSGLDLFIANQFVSTSAMGILSISKTLPKYFLNAIEGIATVFNPGIMIAYAKDDIKDVVKKVNISIKICAALSNVIATVIIVLGRRIYMIWMPGQDYIELQLLSSVAMIGYIIIMPLEPLWTVFTATNKVKVSSMYLLIESIITISMVFILLKFVPNGMWQLIVIAGTSSVAEILRGIFFLPLYSAHCLNIAKNTFYKPMMRSLLSFGLMILIAFGAERLLEYGLLEFFMLLVLILIVSIFSSWILLLNKDERKYIIKMFGRRKKCI